MVEINNISLDDEVIDKFCYDVVNKCIDVYFSGHYDILKMESMEKPCLLKIHKWQYAYSKETKDDKFDSLDSHIGIFSLILYMEIISDVLKMTVLTIDDRVVEFIFEKPIVKVIKLIED